MQADITYNINENDLVMISWTNLCREDRYRNNEWHFPGNMYTQDLYDQKYVKHWASPEWYSRRDFAVIKAAWDILNNKGCQFHFIKMVDFKKFNQWSEEDCQNMNDVINFYNFYLSKIEKSFVDVLWGGDFSARAIKDSLIRKNFNDGHPDISEHLLYLEKTFDYSFSSKTINIVNEKNNELIALIKKNDNDFSSLFFNESEKIFKI